MDLKTYRAYKPLFESTTKKIAKKTMLESLTAIRAKIKKIKEDEDLVTKADAVEEVIKDLDDVVADAVDALGASDPIVGDLVDAAQSVDLQADIVDEEVVMAEEVEDDEKDKEEDDKEMKEEDGEEVLPYEKEKDDVKQESYKPYFKTEKKK